MYGHGKLGGNAQLAAELPGLEVVAGERDAAARTAQRWEWWEDVAPKSDTTWKPLRWKRAEKLWALRSVFHIKTSIMGSNWDVAWSKHRTPAVTRRVQDGESCCFAGRGLISGFCGFWSQSHSKYEMISEMDDSTNLVILSSQNDGIQRDSIPSPVHFYIQQPQVFCGLSHFFVISSQKHFMGDSRTGSPWQGFASSAWQLHATRAAISPSCWRARWSMGLWAWGGPGHGGSRVAAHMTGSIGASIMGHQGGVGWQLRNKDPMMFQCGDGSKPINYCHTLGY